MSRSNGLHRHYDRLTPEERFRLDVLAMARGDAQESQRLVESCPIRNYNMTDWAFSGRWQTTTEMVLAVCVDLSQHMSRLSMIDALLETLPYAHMVYKNEAASAYMNGHTAGSRYAWQKAGKDGDPPGWEELGEDDELDEDAFDPAADEDLEKLEERIEEVDIMPELLKKLEREVARKGWTVWSAFAAFSREKLGVEPEKLVRALLEPALPGIEDLKGRVEALGVEPDEEQAAQIEAALLGTWEHYLQAAKRLSR